MKNHVLKMFAAIVLCSLFSVVMITHLKEIGEEYKYRNMKIEDEHFRNYFYSEQLMEKKSCLSEECKALLTVVENEASYYPIPESSVDKSLKTSFSNSWMTERTFGGKRGHEGTDIMASQNKRGLYPVLSMTDGVITNLGWLEKGGYRVGITSKSGTYYYYAHLESYSNFIEGDSVMAGELLGYMGDSGYGEEGTTGKFDVHLHVGIYFYKNGEEISLNPYFLLKALENKKLKYSYS